MRCSLDATPLLGTRTGVAAFVDGVLRALVARGDVEVSAYGLTWRGRSMLREVLPPGVTSGWAVPAGPLLRLWGHANLVTAERILDLDDDPDVVHGTNFVVPPTRHAGRVVTVHDLTCIRFPEMCTPTSRRYPDLVRRAVERGAWVHTPSEYVAAEVRDRFGAEPDRVRAVHHGVTTVDGDAIAGRKLAGFDSYILAMGTIEPRKDLPLLVRAFDLLADEHPDVGLVVGGAPGWGAATFDEAVAASPHRDRINRPGYVTDAERADLLGGAAVFAFPSVYEGFGLPVLEAMSAGVPVVATRAGAIPEVSGDAARLVDVGDVDGFATALVEAIGQDGAAGRERAARFTWERCASGLVDLYRDCAASRD